jgi:hypothetical protein
MILTGQQIGKLTGVVITAFTRSDLAMLVRQELDVTLDEVVATDDGWRAVVFSFIDARNRLGLGSELIRVIRAARPQHVPLNKCCDELQAQEEVQPLIVSSAPHQPDGALRRAIAAFDHGFHARAERFQWLNAYKALHDVLHELQSFHPTLKAAVEARIAAPDQPLDEEVAFFLTDHLEKAKGLSRNIEFRDNPPDWIAKLETASQVLTGPDVAKMARQVERLKQLPADNLNALNRELVANARRLKPEELLDALNDILAALGIDVDPARRALRADVEEFRNLCSELDELSTAHDLCQRIDDALREAVGLPSVTSEELADWDLAKRSLDELASHRKADKRVQRTSEAAKLFEAANQAEAFRKLVKRFDDLFFETDKALLAVTNQLPLKAHALHTALETFK